ncbi:MAG: hypothetical protein R2724_01455 [Bryobacterales bacterium]
MREMITDVPLIVDAGVGTASDAAIAMELGFDGVLMNTAIAEAQEAEKMAEAKLAVRAGRLAFEAGRMPKRLYASASRRSKGWCVSRFGWFVRFWPRFRTFARP